MRSVDVNQVVDDAKFTPFHMNVLFWCMLVIIFDGYDLVIYGVAMKGLVADAILKTVLRSTGLRAAISACPK